MKHFITRLMLATYIYVRNSNLVDTCLYAIIYFFAAVAAEYFTDSSPTFNGIVIIYVSALAFHILLKIVWWYKKIL